jgi:hypothetical protein
MNALASRKKLKGIPVEYRPIEGPTEERKRHSGGFFEVGGDRGTRVYHFLDSSLERFYGRLARRAKSRAEEDLVRSEYTAFLKYRHHWHSSGLEASPKSVDLDRVFCADPASMSGMAKTERQAFHRQMYRLAAEKVGHKLSILLDNFVCYGWDHNVAADMSPYLFRKTLRRAGRVLAGHWGI